MFTILAGALQPLCRGIAGAGKGLIGGVIFKCTSLMKFNFLIKAAFFAGEGSGYSSCVYLIYDGIHYDPLAVPSSDNSSVPLQTVFPVDDDMRLVEALEIAADAKQVRYLGPGADPGIPERGGGELNTAITFDAKMVSATMPPSPTGIFF